MRGLRPILIACVTLLWLCVPSAAHAQSTPSITCQNTADGVSDPSDPTDPPCAIDIKECAGTDPATGGPYSDLAFTAPVVACIQNSVQTAAMSMLQTTSSYMTPITGMAIVLAIVIFGFRIAGGEQEVVAKGAGFLLRLGFIMFYSANMGTIVTDLFGTGAGDGILNELINITGNDPSSGDPYSNSPWHTIDTTLGKLLGFGAHSTLATGVLGLIGAAVTSSINSPSTGSALFVPAITGLITTMFFFFDIVYTYLKAVILLGFLLIISPFILPLALFASQERFLTQWIKTVMMILITVTMLFAFANMSIQLLQTASGQIITDLGGDARMWGRLNQPVSSVMEANDLNQEAQEKQAEGGNKAPAAVPAASSNIMPFLAMGADQTEALPSIDFSSAPKGDVQTISKLMVDFASLFLLSAVLKYMLTAVPDYAQSIAGVLSSVGFHQSPPMKERFQEGMQDLKRGMGVGIGGVMGGEAGSAVGGAMGGRQGSAMGRAMGGIAGAFAGMNAAVGR